MKAEVVKIQIYLDFGHMHMCIRLRCLVCELSWFTSSVSRAFVNRIESVMKSNPA